MNQNTRQKLIDATFEEVYKKGYQGSALTDILTKAGVHKGSMYHFFKSKKEMALAAVREKITAYFEMRYGWVIAGNSLYLTHFFDVMLDISKRDFGLGCPLANLVQEMSNIDEDFEVTLKEMYAVFRTTIKTVLDKAVNAGEMSQCDTTKLALFITVVIEGALLSAKASGDKNDYLMPIEELISYIKTFCK